MQIKYRNDVFEITYMERSVFWKQEFLQEIVVKGKTDAKI